VRTCFRFFGIGCDKRLGVRLVVTLGEALGETLSKRFGDKILCKSLGDR
jgi:hypothetical protein